MKEFIIKMPITGVVVRAVEANSEDEAIAIFKDEVTINDIETWETHEQIVKGNVFYGVQNEMEIECDDIDEEE